MRDTNKGQLGAKLVPLGHGHIRKKRRVVIPSILLENVGLAEGDPVDFFFDTGDVTGEKAIVIARCENPKKARRKARQKITRDKDKNNG